MIIIQIPGNYNIERNYVLSLIFDEFLGVEYQIQQCDSHQVRIIMDDGKELLMVDKLFSTKEDQWLQKSSLPIQPLKKWDLNNVPFTVPIVSRQIPVIYGDDPSAVDFFQKSDDKIYLGLDIFGSTFFMLTRYEEVVNLDRDEHGRFPATASLAYQEGFLNRPIVNEYLEILWQCLKWLCPELKRKERCFQIYVSHDVDEPFLFSVGGLPRLIRRSGGDILKRLTPIKAMKNVLYWLKYLGADPYDTFDLIMDISEANSLNSAFYFITQHSAGRIDGVYSIDHPLIRKLMRKIYKRGHEIGLHASYDTYQDALQTKKEFTYLKQTCATEGIEQPTWGGRQHFLRWEAPITFQNWEDSGLDYDSTLCYADHIGFRCGVCWDFTVFNLKTRKTLRLKERPLIVMDRTVLKSKYMNLTHEEAWQEINSLKERCMMFSGNFTILWHNHNLLDTKERELYKSIVKK